jgi:alkanesulfonate monooxygenase SsuD/methylene tetrahydromethanopterin reductase-like flavin-dependent oxidoreductase (luciferase family)
VTAVGYALVGGSGTAAERVRHASRAEEAGFSFAMLAERPDAEAAERDAPALHAWSVLGAIAQATATLRMGTIVEAPATADAAELVAHAATTAQALMPGRFFVGLAADGSEGTVPLVLLENGLSIIRERWRADGATTDAGRLDIGGTRFHALPEPLPPIYLAARTPAAAEAAARFGDGLIGIDGSAPVVGSFVAAGGRGPRIGRVAVCWAPTRTRARDICRDPAIPCGPDPADHLRAITTCIEAGYDHIYLEQFGHDQAGFLRFAEGELLPAFDHEALRIAS